MSGLYRLVAVLLQRRRQLLKKEEALAAAAGKLADIDQHMQSLAAKYDKTLMRLAEDRKAVASEAAERDAEESAVQQSREQALAAQAAAEEEQAQFDKQVRLHHGVNVQPQARLDCARGTRQEPAGRLPLPDAV